MKRVPVLHRRDFSGRNHCGRGRRGLVLALMLALLAMRAVGQGLLSGQVTDSLQAPLPGVSVYLTASGGGAGLVYCTSDAQGRFKLAGPASLPDTTRLELRLLGFRPLSRVVIGASRRAQEIRAVLREAPTRLNEVVVHAQRPGIRYNDTTTYEAKQFLNGRQRTLEDLLQNVPGFAVSAEGTISYKGKAIAGVFVEGENLTGGDYQRITRNLDISLVDKIQPVERFVENKLLGGLVRSETTVLNITIPADKKKPLFGSITGELALPRYRNASANVFSYHKRSKFYLLATHNNVGLTQDPLGAALTNPAGASLRTIVWPVNTLLGADPLTASDFRATLSTLNNETTGGFIHVFKPASGNWKLLTDLSLYSNQLRQNRVATTRYLLTDTTFLALAEADQARRATSSVRLRNNFFTPLGEKANLTYENRLSLLWVDNTDALNLTTATEQATLTETIGQALREQPIAFGQNLLLTNRLSETAALQTQVLHTYDDVPQALQVHSNMPARQAAYLGRPLAEGALRQNMRTTQQALSTETEYFKTGQMLNFSAMLGAEFSGSTLTSGLRDAAMVERGAAASPNNLDVSRRRWQGRFRFDKTIGHLTVGGALGGAILQIIAQDETGLVSRRSLYPTGQVGLGLKLGEYTAMRLHYGFDQVFSGPEKLVRQPVLVDYRSFAQGIPTVLVQPEHRVDFRLNYLNSVSLTEIQGFASLGWQGATFGQSLQLDALLSRSTLFIAPAARTGSVQFSIAHLLDKLSTRIQVESSGNYAQSYNQVNGTGQRTNQLWALRNRLAFGTAFAGPINLYGGVTFVSTVLATQANDSDLASFRNNRLQLDWQLIIKHKHLTADLRADQLFINRASYLFLGSTATYMPAKGPLTFYLTVKNLLDTRTFAQITITNISTSSSSFELLPRIIMPGASLRF